jgi:hypothetical protein
MEKIAIINCKAKKKSYPCPAEEMYSVSFQFRHQLDFIKEYYDGYYILSSKYGLITPKKIINPYEITLAKGSRLKNGKKLEGEDLLKWVKKIKNQFEWLKENYDVIDLHISNSYLSHIKDVLDSKTTHIKQPVNPGLVKNRYVEVLETYKRVGKVDLNAIGERRKSKDPEIERWWYHNDYEPFLGHARHLRKKYPIVDEGNASRVSRGLNPHTQGWVIKEESLNQLYRTDSGKWRVKKLPRKN